MTPDLHCANDAREDDHFHCPERQRSFLDRFRIQPWAHQPNPDTKRIGMVTWAEFGDRLWPASVANCRHCGCTIVNAVGDIWGRRDDVREGTA